MAATKLHRNGRTRKTDCGLGDQNVSPIKLTARETALIDNVDERTLYRR